MLDNADLRTVRAARAALARYDVRRYFLPPHSPEWNRIAPAFRQIKYQICPGGALLDHRAQAEAVEEGSAVYGREFRSKLPGRLRLAA